MKYTADDVKKLGTILGVWAHPDDESWCMGGIMAVAATNGQRVVCITATRGDAGQTADEAKWPQSRLGEIREQELKKAMQVLGVTEHIWLDYKDGQLLSADTSTATDQIATIIKDISPDTIFSFGPDGITGHDDHRTIHAWTLDAIQKSGSKANFYQATETQEKYDSVGRKGHELFNIYFNIDEPVTVPASQIDLYFELPQQVTNKKLESLRVQECQTAGLFADPLGREFIQEACTCEAFMKVDL